MWIVTILSLIGVVLNIQKKPSCFVVWSVTNVAWMIYDIRIGAYSQAAMFFVYLILALWGLFKWGDYGKKVMMKKTKRRKGVIYIR